MKKITLTKRVECSGKVISREIQIEVPDDAHRVDIEDAMFRVLTRGAWLSPTAVESGAPVLRTADGSHTLRDNY